MKRIKLGGKLLKYALVDDEDFEYLNQFRWTLSPQGYAVRREYPSGKIVFMHRLIMNCPKNKNIDHKNGNKLDNRKDNLRFCNQSQNGANSRIGKNATGYKGVRIDKRQPGKPYIAQIMVDRKNIYLRSHKTAEEAALSYNKASIKYFGEFARLNRIGG
jgi:hypothetical protein